MIINVLTGIIFIFLTKNIAFRILGIIFIIAPAIAFWVSEEKIVQNDISPKDKEYLKEIGLKTWKFFKDNITKENNFLVCDNYQEDRKDKIVKRTSSTNIGLELISIISSYDLGYIDFDTTIEYLKNVINTIKILPKWNGHLYNWYKIDTLEPLIPRYISTVDSGNLVRIFVYCKKFFIPKQTSRKFFYI